MADALWADIVGSLPGLVRCFIAFAVLAFCFRWRQESGNENAIAVALAILAVVESAGWSLPLPGL